jgi:hypothetical protein
MMPATKWEYVVLRLKRAEMPGNLNKPGAEGWEAFSAVSCDDEACLVFFKRPAKKAAGGISTHFDPRA